MLVAENVYREDYNHIIALYIHPTALIPVCDEIVIVPSTTDFSMARGYMGSKWKYEKTQSRLLSIGSRIGLGLGPRSRCMYPTRSVFKRSVLRHSRDTL